VYLEPSLDSLRRFSRAFSGGPSLTALQASR
jgi:hypothetical protein